MYTYYSPYDYKYHQNDDNDDDNNKHHNNDCCSCCWINCNQTKVLLLDVTKIATSLAYYTLITLLHTHAMHNSLGTKELVESNIGDDGREERVVYG